MAEDSLGIGIDFASSFFPEGEGSLWAVDFLTGGNGATCDLVDGDGTLEVFYLFIGDGALGPLVLIDVLFEGDGALIPILFLPTGDGPRTPTIGGNFILVGDGGCFLFLGECCCFPLFGECGFLLIIGVGGFFLLEGDGLLFLFFV